MSRIKNAGFVFCGGAGLVCCQIVVAKVLPLVGSVFFLITLMFLESIEGHGVPTLQGSADGWPIPTDLGWYYAAAIWWLVWSITLALVVWRRSRESADKRMAVPKGNVVDQ